MIVNISHGNKYYTSNSAVPSPSSFFASDDFSFRLSGSFDVVLTFWRSRLFQDPHYYSGGLIIIMTVVLLPFFTCSFQTPFGCVTLWLLSTNEENSRGISHLFVKFWQFVKNFFCISFQNIAKTLKCISFVERRLAKCVPLRNAGPLFEIDACSC